MILLDLNTASKEDFVNALIMASFDDSEVSDFYMAREQQLLALDFDKDEMFEEFENWLVNHAETFN